MPILHRLRKCNTALLGVILVTASPLSAGSVDAASYCSMSGFAPDAIYYPGTLSANCIAIGDFNGDPWPDFAVGGSLAISVFLNDGTGGFGSPTIYPINGGPTDIITGDFNNDGKVDIAAVDHLTVGGVIVLFGTGTGSFGAPTVSPSGGKGPYYLDKGDFNNDGKLDLAVSNTFDTAGPERNIAVLLGDGMGHFIVGSTNQPTEDLQARDLNDDGQVDVLAGGNPSVSIRWGNGQGNLSAPQFLDMGLPLHFTIADFNHDNKPDIAATVDGAGNAFDFAVSLGDGTGGFRSPTVYEVGADSSSYITSADVNGDGNLDLVANKLGSIGFTPGSVIVLLGTGTGMFGIETYYSLDAQQHPLNLAVADLNLDGRADVVTANLYGGYISVLIGRCLTPTPRYDFDGDGKSDIGVYRPASGFWYALGSSNNAFTARAWGAGTDKIVPGDYDGDNKADLAIFRPSIGTWFILRTTNNTIIATQFGVGTDQPVPADYDADGRTDLAVYRSGTWYINRSTDNVLVTQSYGNSTDRPMPADYDIDGKADLAVYRPSSGTWFIQQSLNLQLRAIPFGTDTDQPVTGDFDGDGEADVAVYRPSTGTWYALRTSNDSLFVARWGTSTDIPVAADYDGDGKTDVAVWRPTEGTWYMQQSTAGFRAVNFGTNGDVPVPSGYVP